MITYGRAQNIEELDLRRGGFEGNLEHRQKVEDQERHRLEEKQRDEKAMEEEKSE